MSDLRKLWIALGLVLLSTFLVLGFFGREIEAEETRKPVAAPFAWAAPALAPPTSQERQQ